MGFRGCQNCGAMIDYYGPYSYCAKCISAAESAGTFNVFDLPLDPFVEPLRMTMDTHQLSKQAKELSK